MGFGETHKDPRGVKGEWEAVVTVRDTRVAALLERVSSRAVELESKLPWEAAYKRTSTNLPAVDPVLVASAHGGIAPVLPAGLDLPNDDAVRTEYGTRSMLLTNVIRAIDQARIETSMAGADPARRAEALRWAPYLSELRLALHEVFGHASGRASEGLLGHDPARYLKEWTTAVEEARAELVYLHLLESGVASELLPGCHDACALEGSRAFLRRAWWQLRHVRGDRIVDDFRRARQLIVAHAMVKGAIEPGDDGYELVDRETWREANAELLARLQRIKSEGLHPEAAALMTARAVAVDPALRDRVRARARLLQLPSDYAFVVPRLALRDGDVEVRYVSP